MPFFQHGNRLWGVTLLARRDVKGEREAPALTNQMNLAGQPAL